MSTLKDKIEKLKSLFNSFGEEAENKEESFSGKTYTESELNISNKEVGGKVELVQADGSLEVAPDGDYEMDNGDKFKVEGGFIVEWNGEKEAPAKEEEKPMDEEMADEPVATEPNQCDALKAELEAMKAETEALKQMIEELKASFSKYTEQEESQAEQFNQKLDELNSSLKVLATIPAEFSKTNQSNIVKDNNSQKFNDWKSLFGIK